MSERSKNSLRLWLGLLKLSRLTENELREMLRTKHGTTLPRFDILAILDKYPAGLKMSDLSRYLMVSNGNVTGLVDRMMADGMVDRLPVPDDRRATLVKLTQAGQQAFLKQAADHESWVEEKFASLTDQELADMLQNITTLRKGNQA